MDSVTSNRISSIELEKHLDDYKKGKAGNSKKTAQKLPKADISSYFEITNINPSYSKNYSSYISAFNYDSKARYVKNINDSIVQIRKLFNNVA